MRRRLETVRDVDLIATATDPAALTEHFVSHFRAWPRWRRTAPTKATVVSLRRLPLRPSSRAPRELREPPPALHRLEGPQRRPARGRRPPQALGLRVRRRAVETGRGLPTADEEELYAHLGYAWIPPELRENRGELEAAREGELPELVELGDLQGDLHMHTTWSDGRGTLEEMVEAARSSAAATSRSATTRKRLRGEPARAPDRGDRGPCDESYDDIEVLAGIEVDIRRDGSLDVDDELLAARDWVMASIHSGFTEGRAELTKRLLAAMRESARRLHRPSDGAEDRTAARPTTSTVDAVLRARAPRPGRSSRSTPSPTGST